MRPAVMTRLISRSGVTCWRSVTEIVAMTRYISDHPAIASAPVSQVSASATVTPEAAANGSTISAARAPPKARISRGMRMLPTTAPMPQAPNSMPSRQSPSWTPRVRSAQTTRMAISDPALNATSTPMTIITRMISCRRMNRVPSATADSRSVLWAGRAPVSGRTMPRISSADATNVSTSMAMIDAGEMTTMSAPASVGTTVSATVLPPATSAFAAGSRSRPTSVGSAPWLAASKNT